jgi:hypothetical protein
MDYMDYSEITWPHTNFVDPLKNEKAKKTKTQDKSHIYGSFKASN